MKLFFYFFLFLIISFVSGFSAKAQIERFPVGEKITYHISFANFSDAGFVEMQTVARAKVGDRDTIHLRARLKTTGIVEATLLSLDNEYNSFISPDMGLPLRIERTLRNSNAATDVKRDFAENLNASPNNIHDLVSAIYYIRTLPLALNSTFPIRVTEDNQVYEAELKVIKRITVSSAVGAFNAFVVQAGISNNDKYNRFRLQMLVSDDDRRLPVSFQLRHTKGEIRAELASVQILLPEIPTPQIEPTSAATPFPTPIIPATPRPTATPRPYVENMPLASELPFALKERLVFDVTRQNQKIGTIQFDISDRKLFQGRDAVNITAKVVNTTDPFLPAGSSFTSYIHPQYLTPFRSEIRAAGTLIKFSNILNFDQDRGMVTTEKASSFEIPVGSYDLLSLAYALRTFRIENARDTKAAVFFGNSAKICSFALIKRETVEIGGRKIKALQLNVTLGDPKSDSLALKLWLSDDAQRLPLRFSFNSPLGLIQAEITNISP